MIAVWQSVWPSVLVPDLGMHDGIPDRAHDNFGNGGSQYHGDHNETGVIIFTEEVHQYRHKAEDNQVAHYHLPVKDADLFMAFDALFAEEGGYDNPYAHEDEEGIEIPDIITGIVAGFKRNGDDK